MSYVLRTESNLPSKRCISLATGEHYDLCFESGPYGYANYVAAKTDPQHDEHEEMRKWRGPWDPEAFDVNKATKQMRKVK